MDTICGSHIWCAGSSETVENEDESDMDLEVDNGAKVAAVAAKGTWELGLPLRASLLLFFKFEHFSPYRDKEDFMCKH